MEFQLRQSQASSCRRSASPRLAMECARRFSHFHCIRGVTMSNRLRDMVFLAEREHMDNGMFVETVGTMQKEIHV